MSIAIFDFEISFLSMSETLMKLVVDGYVRFESSIDQTNYSIPQLVNLLICTYYPILEYFTVYGKGVKLNDHKDISTVIKDGNFNNTVFGNIQVSNSTQEYYIYTWTLKFIQIFSGIIIGIGSAEKNNFNEDDWDETCYGYGDTYLYHNQQTSMQKYKGIRWKNGDILKMIINTKTKTLSYDTNGKNEGIAFENIDFNGTRLQLAIFMGSIPECIQIVDFKQIRLS
eukprot:167232_1